MSDRNNSDNQNTNTIYIPREVRNPQPPQRPLRRVQQNPQRNGGQSVQNPQQNMGQYYREGQIPNQPYQNGQYYREGQIPNQPYQNGQYYREGQAPNQPYQNGQYYREGQIPNQPYQNGQYYREGQAPNQPPPYAPYPRQAPREQPYYADSQPKKPPHKKEKKRRKKSFIGKFIGRFVRTLLVMALVVFGMYSCTSLSLINKMDYTVTGERNRRSDALSRSYVTNVLIIGTDGRTADEAARSDTMIIASINNRTNQVSLISLMRDCYVEIPGYSNNKLNAAYTFGGPELLMDTIEHNFGIAVEDYISLNFISVANIVDSVGGIDIEISDAEAQEINTILQAEVNEIMGDNSLDDLLKKGGKLHLNGKQALSYARIRYVGNADFERTERQREVIGLVMDKLKSLNPTILPKLSTSVLPDVKTNMSTAELYWLSLKVPFIIGYDRQQLRIPAENTYYGQNMDCGDSLIVDFNANYNIIYENAYSE